MLNFINLLFKKDKLLTYKLDFNETNELEIIVKRISDYNQSNDKYEAIFKADAETFDFLNSGVNQIRIKSDLKKFFVTLNDKDFYDILKPRPISIVFFYLPCKIFSI